jgi:hypothetical protein
MITVVSACYGGYDAPAVPVVNDAVRWVMVNDGQVDVPAPWESVLEYRSHLHPRMAAKIPKCFPHRYADTDIVIWLDSSAVIVNPDFVSVCVAALGDGDIAQWTHPQRNDIVEEADVSSCMTKYALQDVQAQAAHYVKYGHPRNFGLWATGCMVWRVAPWNERVGTGWLVEQNNWTYQDQLSWPVIVRRHDVDVRPMPGSLWDKQTLIFRPHATEA